MLKAVLLDVDGTLIDSNDFHAESWASALVDFGYAAKPSDVRPLIGMGGDKLLPELIGHTEESELGQKITERRKLLFREKYINSGRIKAFPGTRDLLQRLKRQGLSLYPASSAEDDILIDLLKVARVDDLVDTSVLKKSREETSDPKSETKPESKPSPDIIQSVLMKTGLKTEDTLLLGDTPFDIEAASRAGVGTVALLCGGWSAVELRDAIAIYQDPADLLLHFETSPFSGAEQSGLQQGRPL